MAAADITVVPRGRGSVTVLWRHNGRARTAIMNAGGEYSVWERGRMIASGSPRFISRGFKNDGGFRDAASRSGLGGWARGYGTIAEMDRRFAGQYASGYGVTGETVGALSREQAVAAVQRARGVAGANARDVTPPWVAAVVADTVAAAAPRAGSPAQASSSGS